MRNKLLLLFCAVAILLAGCSKDDDPPKSDNPSSGKPLMYVVKYIYDEDTDVEIEQAVAIDLSTGTETLFFDNIRTSEGVGYINSTNEIAYVDSEDNALIKIKRDTKSKAALQLEQETATEYIGYEQFITVGQKLYIVKYRVDINTYTNIEQIVAVDVSTGIETVFLDNISISENVGYVSSTNEIVYVDYAEDKLVKVKLDTKSTTTFQLEKGTTSSYIRYDKFVAVGQKLYISKYRKDMNTGKGVDQIAVIDINTGVESIFLDGLNVGEGIGYISSTNEIVYIDDKANKVVKVKVDTKNITAFQLEQETGTKYISYDEFVIAE